MASKLSWDNYEIAYLLVNYIKLEKGKVPRESTISKMSKHLRKRAVNMGLEIDSKFRNIDTINTQLKSLGECYSGKFSGRLIPTKFKYIVDLYKENRKAFDLILCPPKPELEQPVPMRKRMAKVRQLIIRKTVQQEAPKIKIKKVAPAKKAPLLKNVSKNKSITIVSQDNSQKFVESILAAKAKNDSKKICCLVKQKFLTWVNKRVYSKLDENPKLLLERINMDLDIIDTRCRRARLIKNGLYEIIDAEEIKQLTEKIVLRPMRIGISSKDMAYTLYEALEIYHEFLREEFCTTNNQKGNDTSIAEDPLFAFFEKYGVQYIDNCNKIDSAIWIKGGHELDSLIKYCQLKFGIRFTIKHSPPFNWDTGWKSFDYVSPKEAKI